MFPALLILTPFSCWDNFGLVLVGENGSTYSTDISLTANTKWTVEVLNRLADGVKVKSFEITFENGKLEGETVNLIEDRQVILSGIRIK